MRIADLAELLSAFAAFLTVSLTFIELSSRSKSKRADMAMDVYSDFLYIKQQLAYAVESAQSFMHSIGKYSDAELSAYAKAHSVDPKLFSVIQHFTKESISSFEALSKKSKDISVLILEFSGKTTGLLQYIDTFFGAYSVEPSRNVEKIKEACRYILNSHQEVLSCVDEVGTILKGNLKETHSKSNLYLIVLIVLTVLLLLFCFWL